MARMAFLRNTSPPLRLWAAGEVFIVFVACLSVYTMYRSWALTAPFFGASSAVAQNTYWKGYGGDKKAWQWTGQDTTAGFFLNETRGALEAMQRTFWNGSYWPSTIQWIGALTDTIVASTERTFIHGLHHYSGDAPSRASASAIEQDILKYYSQIRAYYDSEDTIQIFGSAYDDAQWVVLEWLEVIRFLDSFEAYSGSGLGADDVGKYAHRARIFYNIVQDEFDTSLCQGGLTWNPALETYKNAITNELFVSSSIAMYLYFPGDSNSDPYPHPDYTAVTNRTLPPLPELAPHDPLLLQNAQATWAWMKTHNFTNDQGLIVDGFHISAGQTNCDERNEMVYTYNQGVMLTGLRGLWEGTGDVSYLQDGYDLVGTVIDATGWTADVSGQAQDWQGLGRNGILEDYCDAPANCSQDNLIFKGAYFQHLDYFCQSLPTTTPAVQGISKLATPELAASHDSKCDSWLPWVQHNAHAALSTRDSSNIMGEWWGAPFANRTQGPAPEYARAKPSGSMDICNEPELLEQPPWRCESSSCRHHDASRLRRKRSVVRPRQASDNRTVETQAQGLAVLKAATDLTLRKEDSTS